MPNNRCPHCKMSFSGEILERIYTRLETKPDITHIKCPKCRKILKAEIIGRPVTSKSKVN